MNAAEVPATIEEILSRPVVAKLECERCHSKVYIYEVDDLERRKLWLVGHACR